MIIKDYSSKKSWIDFILVNFDFYSVCIFDSSTVILDGMVVHLVYIVEGPVLFLIGAPSMWY